MRKRELDRFICPDCGSDEYEIEEEWDTDDEGQPELLSKDIVCNDCGYRESIY